MQRNIAIAIIILKLIILLVLIVLRKFHLQTKSEENIIVFGPHIRIVSREEWMARTVMHDGLDRLNLPVSHVVVTATNGAGCETKDDCEAEIRFIQDNCIDIYKHGDIAYNFLIDADGNVYEGRGWNYKGIFWSSDMDRNNIAIGYIGMYTEQSLSARQLYSTQLLLDEGIRLGKLKLDYKITKGMFRLTQSIIQSIPDPISDSFKGWEHWMD